ncbi:MAG: carbohydrate kinase family protein, partial [Bulleidia sp.]
MTRPILCIGDLNADVIVPYGKALDLRSALSADETADVTLQGGGTMGNCCTVLNKLGDHPRFVTDLCTDSIGIWLNQELIRGGTDLSWSVDQGNHAIVCIAVLNHGDRLVFPWLPPGSHLPRFNEASFAKIPMQDYLVVASGMLLTNEPETMHAVLTFLKKLKLETHSILYFDLNLRIETYGLNEERREAYEEMIGLADLLTGSGIEEFGPLSEERDLIHAAGKLSSSTRTVIARNGPGSVYVVSPDSIAEVPPEDVQVLSTLGAGDTFNAAFVHD